VRFHLKSYCLVFRMLFRAHGTSMYGPKVLLVIVVVLVLCVIVSGL
jgi:hypothetical protein